MAFGARLKGYSDRSGGIDKSYFENIAKKAMAGIVLSVKDIEEVIQTKKIFIT